MHAGIPGRPLPARGFQEALSKMDRIRIVGGNPLTGNIPISGAKNAALPLMIAGMLTDEKLVLENVPRLADVAQLQRILGNHGIDITVNGKRRGDDAYAGQTMEIDARVIVDTTAPYELVSKMRASFWVIGPLVARMGEARVSLPGGCAIGTRPVDFHLDALRALGAEIEIDAGYVVATRAQGPEGRAYRVPEGLGRRHPHRHHGGQPRRRRDHHRERRARAGGRRRRRLHQRHGRAHRGAGHRDHPHRRRAAAAAAPATPCCRTASRPAPMPWRWR